MDRLVLGTVSLANVSNPDKLLDEAYDRGFRRFDLARTYGMGESEKCFGKWMENAAKKGGLSREEITIITKGGMGDDKYGDPGKSFSKVGGF